MAFRRRRRARRRAVYRRLRSGSRRKVQRERAPLAGNRGHRDVAVLQTRELATQEQPEPGPLQMLGLRSDHPTETSEERVHAFRGNAEAGIGYRYPGDAGPCPYLACDRTAGRRVFDRVAEQVRDDRPGPVRVDVDSHAPLRQIELELVHGIDQGSDVCGRGPGDFPQVRLDEPQCQGAVLESGGFDHLFDQLVHLGDFGGHHDRGLATSLVEVSKQPTFEHRDVTADHRHRPAQLVRGKVQELGLVALDGGHPLGHPRALEPCRYGGCVRPEL